MDLEAIRNYCIVKKGVSESFPFDETTLVFKVGGKMFALIDIDDCSSINLKCDPDKAVELREQFEEITPGFHMNKKHWNTVLLTGSLSNKMVLELIDHSYNLVFLSLSKKLRNELEG
ncbi:MAG: MmcQ/YjbR family DNA-binding protein [Crocinitomicaceae bacterium]|nr:MmcQ/YjbR family DNA-binding protein [Crocinitomicaceae bacterium]